MHWHHFPRRADDPDRLEGLVWLAPRSGRPRPRRTGSSGERAHRAFGNRRPSSLDPRIVMNTLRIGTRGSPLAALAGQSRRRSAARRPSGTRDRACPDPDDRRPGPGGAALQLRRRGGLHEGDPERASRAPGRRRRPQPEGSADDRDAGADARRGAGARADRRCPCVDAARVVRRGFAGQAGVVAQPSSLRRRSQILHRRSDLKLVEIRGNVDTRLRKLAEQDLDAIVLAEAAGSSGSGLEQQITEVNSTPGVDVPCGGTGGSRDRVPGRRRGDAEVSRRAERFADAGARGPRGAGDAANARRRLSRPDRRLAAGSTAIGSRSPAKSCRRTGSRRIEASNAGAARRGGSRSAGDALARGSYDYGAKEMLA